MTDAFWDADRGEAPTTAMLERALEGAARVLIIETTPDQLDRAGAARVSISGSELADLARLLAIVDGGTGDHCRCMGWPTILVFDAAEAEIAKWTLHHQSGLRGLGSCDADLRDGPALTAWLAAHGLTGSRDVQAMVARERLESERRRTRWVAAAPPGLTEAAEACSLRQQDAEELLGALFMDRYRDALERSRLLLAWAGFPARETDGTPWHETAAQRMLLREDPDVVFAALDDAGPAELDGAAELFTSFGWTKDPQARPALPEPLVEHLIAHVSATGTDPMKFRMRHGYGAGRVD